LAPYDRDYIGSVHFQQCIPTLDLAFGVHEADMLQTTSLGNAYGVCVMFVTFFDTCMVSLTAIFVWRLRPILVFLPWLTIACLDGTFLSSALCKVPAGAWFTIMLAVILALVFLVWRFGKEQQWLAEAEDRFSTSHFVRPGPDEQLYLTERFHGDPLSHIKGFGIFFDKAGETTPTVFSQFMIKLTAIPEVMVFFHLRPLEVPSVAPEDRHSVSRLAIPNCYRLVVRYGYNDEVISPDLASVVYEQIRIYSERNEEDKVTVLNGNAGSPPNVAVGQDLDAMTGKYGAESGNPELAILEAAFAHKVLYIIGKEQMRIKANTGYFRKFLLHIFLWTRENSRAKMANLNVPADRVIEVGFLKEI
jgi:KUP system potassium uptake protein